MCVRKFPLVSISLSTPFSFIHYLSTPFSPPPKNRTLLQARMLYYWPTIRVDIIQYIDKCQSYAENHGSVARPVSIKSYPIPTEPWETLAIDLLKLPLTTEGHKYLLVCIDHFSRFSILVPLKDKQAKTVARALIDEVFCKFNTPTTLLSDNGTEFNNNTLDAICTEYGIQQTNIIAYHPASNGLVERNNRKILQHLHTLVGNVSSSWHEWMPQVMASLNPRSLDLCFCNDYGRPVPIGITVGKNQIYI